jgi:hypothetical protein
MNPLHLSHSCTPNIYLYEIINGIKSIHVYPRNMVKFDVSPIVGFQIRGLFLRDVNHLGVFIPGFSVMTNETNILLLVNE